MRLGKAVMLSGLLICLVGCDSPTGKGDSDFEGTPATEMNLTRALGGEAGEGFARANQLRPFQFPQDHAAHPEFRNEWWYITGNLEDQKGRHFGYQLTLFRIALSPDMEPGLSRWSTNQIWMAHVALTDVASNQHWHDQRLARGAHSFAGQNLSPFRVWLEDWQITGQQNGEFPWKISVDTEKFSLDLSLSQTKPPVLQGDQGLSQKGSQPGNASYYYSMTRLKTSGTISTAEGPHSVSGSSWLDREWSTSALDENQVGWDWFSLQTNDNHELMFYRIRTRTGETDRHSAGKWVSPDGQTVSLAAKDVDVKELDFATSQSGRRYPVKWMLSIPIISKTFQVEALVTDQEMQTGIVYWEGAVALRDDADITGYGYVEMTGY